MRIDKLYSMNFENETDTIREYYENYTEQINQGIITPDVPYVIFTDIQGPGINRNTEYEITNIEKSVIEERQEHMQEKINIKVKKLHEDAVIPVNAHDGDAGGDLVAIDNGEIIYHFGEISYIQYRTGIAIEPPDGFHTEIFPRSSISKYDLVLANSIGLVDEGYRGEILCRFKPTKTDDSTIRKYNKGDRIAQLVIRKTYVPNFIEVQNLSDTSRGQGGFGSSGS